MSYKQKLDISKRIDLINQNYYMLGILATEEESYPNIGFYSTLVSRNDYNDQNLIFYVKSITTEPSLLLELELDTDLFVGYSDYSLSNVEKRIKDNKYNYVEIDEKESLLKKRLTNKIMLLKLRIEEDHKGREKYYKNFYIEDMEEFNGIKNYQSIEDIYNEEFIPLPIAKLSEAEFENKMLAGESITFPNFNILEYEIDKILVNNTLYFDPQNNWEIKSSNKCTNTAPSNLEQIELPADFNKNILYKYNNDLIFISNNYNIKLDKMKSEKIDFSNKQKIDDLKKLKSAMNRKSNVEKNRQMVSKNKDLENKNKKVIEVNQKEKKELKSVNNSKENDFLDQLYQKALSENLYYKKEDLYNLHISIKTSPLTVISGMSGTGKTRMAQLYAETLSLNYNQEYIIIPISPSYTEPGDVLGYLNTMTGIYTPAETGLVDLLKEAENNKDKIYMVIFDEMNLSQVEHWFSPFISLLELKDEARKLTLFNKNSTCHNNYKPEIKIGNNVIFVGTVNIDETTKDFSDRLLDRSNVITPEKMNFSNIKEELEKTDNLNNKDLENKSFNKIKFFDDWREEAENSIKFLSKQELSLLDELHETLNNVDSQKGVSFRIVENIARYIKNIPIDEKGNQYIEYGRAFDLQVKQRILTKLKGHQQQYGDLIGELNPNEPTDEIENSKIYNILSSDKAQKISAFNHSLEELKRKAKEMYYNGYAT
ncbi:AAA domain (dynein-related subfamily) [Halanaerobium congolense]|jgi:hypothetical protein|uniref:AAA domain (Dynein-related subfamily) n=1 Tax=Halanaerobium congolense TaxID=54121 RepID=A0A1G8S5V7_9FIRM|nr:AAA family ATPase [Halanaerobium congolense]TDS26855.1 dynein-related subfamily AAA family protein [Halanaerobium congolense]SDJ24634.1 AAA domain (dynein-related subfamily) [Halanaerobium congolense]SET75716.1 AAA domain (dynein-related subfamily) [Halanaerobium congolense]